MIAHEYAEIGLKFLLLHGRVFSLQCPDFNSKTLLDNQSDLR